ncbi:hypothetical protein LT85_3791 [Collimonas arenae]|uniref:Uncharacterized protein n=1 Tax=Collimonas arenae TaxID=279058 RepID=A0A0A1FH44_9BURK|nr:hypothetical protein [Collimonas arenae]AIY42949.1 hypothetical protein LT85_3791 [Collimonas arenae]
MAFKETKGSKTIEARVTPAPGGMFKGVVEVSTQRGNQVFVQTIGKGCGRPVKTEQAALELAEREARRLIGL